MGGYVKASALPTDPQAVVVHRGPSARRFGQQLGLHAAVMDAAGSSRGYIVPAICLALVAAYALFNLRNTRPAIIDEEDEPVTPAGGAI